MNYSKALSGSTYGHINYDTRTQQLKLCTRAGICTLYLRVPQTIYEHFPLGSGAAAYVKKNLTKHFNTAPANCEVCSAKPVPVYIMRDRPRNEV